LKEIFYQKFRGLPQKREGKFTDFVKGKIYFINIENTYKIYGLDPLKIQRVFVTWYKDEQKDYEKFCSEYEKKHGFKIDILYLRDQILPELENKISSSNYDDEVLRTLSLLKQRKLQTGI
jgi:hypothetical protein